MQVACLPACVSCHAGSYTRAHRAHPCTAQEPYMLMHIRAQILCLGTWRGILAVGGALQTMRMLAKADALGNHEAREHDQMTTERKEKLAQFHP